MKTTGLFIGVEKYEHPNILDLPCAGQDARALWSLYTDTFNDMETTLLLSEDAKVDNLRKSLEDVLLNASREDSVVISFSGHGSYDYALVPSDADLDRLKETTITTDEISSLFKKSKAKSILLILDCCFSGATPARVIGTPAQARSMSSPLKALLGQGRAIITASSDQEPSWESQRLGHGLLTKGLIDIMTSLEKETSLPEVMQKVIEKVTDFANQIHKTQTPTLLLYAEGSFVTRPLKIGDQYSSIFPDTFSIKVSSKISDLEAFTLPAKVLKLWSSRFPNGLNQLQIEAINDGKVLSGNSLSVIAPTSSGKTFVGELAALGALQKRLKTVFLVPYKALADEQLASLQSSYEDLDLRVIKCTGDSSDQAASILAGKFDIAILTYEMFLGLISRNRWLIEIIGLVVLDEAHFITDKSRGITVELILTLLRVKKVEGIEPQLLLLSAVVDEFNGFDDWLDIQVLMHRTRPVPLREGVIDRTGTFTFQEGGEKKKETMIPSREVIQRKRKSSNQDLLVPLVKKLVEDGDKVLIFRNQKGATSGCAKYLSKDLGLPAAQDAVEELPLGDLSSSSNDLRECLMGGTAFHNTSLSSRERQAVERSFRDPDSNLKVLVATSTVAAGVNLPAENVIIVEHEFMGRPPTQYTVAQYKNMAGRAGRTGLVRYGRSFLYAGSSRESDQLFGTYVTGSLEPIISSFNADDLDTWILRLLSSIDAIQRDETVKLLINTFGGFQETRQNPEWPKNIAIQIEELVNKMVELNLLDENSGQISLTALGTACAASTLSFDSCLFLLELLQDQDDIDANLLLVITNILPELDDTYTPVVTRGRSDHIWINQSSQVSSYAAQLLQKRMSGDQRLYLARCKRVCVMRDWISAVPLLDIEKKYNKPFATVDAGWIRSCANQNRFRLRSVIDITLVAYPELEEKIDDFETLLVQLEFGVTPSIAELVKLGINLTRAEYLVLMTQGFDTTDDIKDITDDQLEEYFGIERAKEIRVVIDDHEESAD